MSKATNAGTDFEIEVANLYRILDYSVETNLDLGGFQIDLIAKREIPGFGETKLIIECKYKSTGSVSNDEALKISSILLTEAVQRQGFQKAVLVTNATFSQKAKDLENNNSHLVLKTIKELEDETLDLFTAYGRYKRDYEQTSLHAFYLPLSGSGYLPGNKQIDKTLNEVEHSLIQWIDNGEPGFLTILADFGAGKTTLLERIKYYYCDLYERKNTNVKPIIFKAKDRHKYNTIDDYLLQTAREEFGNKADLGMLWRFINEGRLLLLIDGFDEVAQRVDAERRKEYFIDLSLLFNTPCHSIMTCRPTFFFDQLEYDNLVNELSVEQQRSLNRIQEDITPLGSGNSIQTRKLAETMSINYLKKFEAKLIRGLKIGKITLSEFSEDQIETYLKQQDENFQNSCSVSWKDVQTFLYAVYDIKDLMHRPILLNMIILTVLSGEINTKDHKRRIGAADIYQAYISALLKREHSQRETRRLISSQTRESLLNIIAINIYQNNSMDISFQDVLNVIDNNIDSLKEKHQEIDKVKPEHLASDIVLTGFLSIDSGGTFRFSHKSFMEFLVARYITDKLLGGDVDEIIKEPLPKDLLYFIGSFLIGNRNLFDKLVRKIRTLKEIEHKVIRNNLAMAIVYSGISHEDFSMIDVELTGISAAEIYWKAVELERIKINVSGLKRQKYESSVLRKMNFQSPTGDFFAQQTELDCVFEYHDLGCFCLDDSYGSLTSKSGTLKRMEIINSQVTLIGTWSMKELVCENSEIQNKDGIIKSDNITIQNCFKCHFDSIKSRHLKILESEVTFGDLPQILSKIHSKNPDNSIEPSMITENSTIQISPFRITTPISINMLGRIWRIKNCKVAGMQIEESASSVDLWPECEGVFFLTNDKKHAITKYKKNGFIVVKNFIFIDATKFRSDNKLAIKVLKLASQMFGTWIQTWIKQSKNDLKTRLDEHKKAH